MARFKREVNLRFRAGQELHHRGATDGAFALEGGLAIFGGDRLRFCHLAGRFALHAIGFVIGRGCGEGHSVLVLKVKRFPSCQPTGKPLKLMPECYHTAESPASMAQNLNLCSLFLTLV